MTPLLLALLGAAAGTDADSPLGMPRLRVAVVQNEIPSHEIWDPARRVENFDSYITETEKIGPGAADLVIWPENAAPFLLDADVAARERIAALATKLDAAILLGAPRSESVGDGRAVVHNSAWFFAPNAPEPMVYDKRRLLPFVETAASPLTGTEAEYAPGNNPFLFEFRVWRIAPLICFESIYPEYAREAVARGAHLLVNISNDAWFASGAGPEQHHSMSILRAVENRRPMVRVANGGVSGAVNFNGSSIGVPIKRTRATQIYEIPPPPRGKAVYITVGDVVPLVAGAIALLAIALALAASLRGSR
jgi:apolipoprotein N-acyltransferase